MSRGRYRRFARTGWGRWFDYALAIAILGLFAVLASRLDRTADIARVGNATVHDGDTLTVGGQRIRLRGIDAPEYLQTCGPTDAGYPCGREARRALAQLTAGRQVSCQGWEIDRYNRLLGVCSAGAPALDINREMVRLGWAVAYGSYWSDEKEAREAKRGIWRSGFQLPRDWRTAHQPDQADDAPHDSGRDIWRRILDWLRQLL